MMRYEASETQHWPTPQGGGLLLGGGYILLARLTDDPQGEEARVRTVLRHCSAWRAVSPRDSRWLVARLINSAGRVVIELVFALLDRYSEGVQLCRALARCEFDHKAVRASISRYGRVFDSKTFHRLSDARIG